MLAEAQKTHVTSVEDRQRIIVLCVDRLTTHSVPYKHSYLLTYLLTYFLTVCVFSREENEHH